MSELKLNHEDILKFYRFLGHEKYSHFHVFTVNKNGKHEEITNKPSYAGDSVFINNENELVKLCEQNNEKGIICLGINEREKDHSKINDGIYKINMIPFDIDIKSNLKESGITPRNYFEEMEDLVKKIRKKLNDMGFSVDYIANSGNGIHLGIKTNIDIEKYTEMKGWKMTDTYKKLHFLTDEIKKLQTKNIDIDSSVTSDLAQRIKIPGTFNIKRYKIEDKYKIIDQKNWRQAYIIDIDEDPDIEKNNQAFYNLKILEKKEENTKKSDVSNFTKDLESLLNKDKKLKKLFSGDYANFKSRSEAEQSLVTKLVFYRYKTRAEIDPIMNNCGIGKWQEKGDDYKNLTLQKAIDLIETEKKNWWKKDLILKKLVMENPDIEPNKIETWAPYVEELDNKHETIQKLVTYFKRKKIPEFDDAYLIAKKIIEEHKILIPDEFVYHNSYKCLYYKNGYWVEESKNFINKLLHVYLTTNFAYTIITDRKTGAYLAILIKPIMDFHSNSSFGILRSSIHKHLTSLCFCRLEDFDSNPYLINVKNGIIDISDWKNDQIKFTKHDPELMLRRQIPIKYDQKSGETFSFYNEIFHEDDIPLIDQYSGLCLTSIMKFQKGLIGYGRGNNGKDTFINFLITALGESNTSNVDLVDLEDDFLFSTTENKLLIASGEVDCDTRIKIKQVKAYIGAAIQKLINKKFKTPYHATPTAKMIYAVNDTFPNIPDSTDKGFFRKWIIVEFPYNFDGKEDRDKLSKLTTEDLLSKWLNRSLKGLLSLLKNGFIDDCHAAIEWEEVKNIWLSKINPFSTFIENNGTIGKYETGNENPNNEFWEFKKFVREKYDEWRSKEGKPITKGLNQMTRLVQQAGFSKTERMIQGKKKDVYIGFKLNEIDPEKTKVLTFEEIDEF